MSVETVLSIVESATGGGTVSRLLAMSSAEYLAFGRANAASMFFKAIPGQIAAWTARLRYLGNMGELTYLQNLARLYSGNFAYQSQRTFGKRIEGRF